MNLTAFIIQFIGGALGGNAAGRFSSHTNLGAIGNTIVGALGGAVGGQILNAFLGLPGTVENVAAFVTGGVSGGLIALVVGFLKSKLSA